jgi:hypothetical protein
MTCYERMKKQKDRTSFDRLNNHFKKDEEIKNDGISRGLKGENKKLGYFSQFLLTSSIFFFLIYPSPTIPPRNKEGK